MTKLSDRLHALRTQHTKKLREIGKKSGLSISYLSDIERGRTNPSLETCQRLANVYKITLSEMFMDVKI